MSVHPDAVRTSPSQSFAFSDDPLYAQLIALREERAQARSLREQGELAVLIEEEFRRIAAVQLGGPTDPTTLEGS